LWEGPADAAFIAAHTAGIAGPAALGIRVTDRRHAAGVAFVTGHSQA
jgi:uroporphyrin-III C-methyltransferase